MLVEQRFAGDKSKVYGTLPYQAMMHRINQAVKALPWNDP